MDNIKIAFFDIDGTLTNSNKIITDKTKESLKYLHNKGVKLVLASGRFDDFALEYNKDLNVFDYLICNNGAEIIDINNNKLIYFDNLTTKLDLIINNINTKNIIFNGLHKEYTLEDNYKENNIYQVVAITKTKEEVNNIIEFTKKNDLKVTYISSAYYKDIDTGRYTTNINLENTSKGHAIKILLSILNISKDDSICFGDNDNDISMFNECGIKVAMDNGMKELKDMADYITLNNNEDGVAHFINEYIKRQ